MLEEAMNDSCPLSTCPTSRTTAADGAYPATGRCMDNGLDKPCCICWERSPGWPDEAGWVKLREDRFSAERWCCARCWANLHAIISLQAEPARAEPKMPRPVG